MSRMIPGLWVGCLGLLTVVSEPLRVNAGLILDPHGQTYFNGQPADEDTAKPVNGLNFKFYGNMVSQILVSENGNLKFSADNDFSPTALGSPSKARIAPLWDDFLLDTGLNNRVVVDQQSGKWLAVTWENVRLFLESPGGSDFQNSTRTAQVVIFESDQLIRGHQFLANDIAFAYRAHVAGTPNFGDHLVATVGLDSGSGTLAALPGTADGRVTAANDHLLPWEENNFLLLRPTDSAITNYSVSTQTLTAVPEPAATTMLIIVFIGLTTSWRTFDGGIVSRRRQAIHHRQPSDPQSLNRLQSGASCTHWRRLNHTKQTICDR